MTDASGEPPIPQANILLVDDSPDNLLALEAILEDLGQNLVRCLSGEQALRRLEESDFALVLLDVQMQGMDGFKTAQLMRARERSRHVPIIFLTAYDTTDFPPVRAYSLGAVDYLTKPLVPEILRAKVAGFVELYRKSERLQRQAEQLRQSEQQIRTLVQDVKDYAIFLLDPQGQVAGWNAGAESIYGYRADEIIGQHFGRFCPEPDVQQGKPQREVAIAAAEGKYAEEGWRVRKDGSQFWASVVMTALRDTAGHLKGFSKIIRDLTERKRAEEALQRANEELEARVRDRTAELTRANQALQAEVRQRERAQEALKAAARRKDEFMAMLAHELRNPLAPVRNGLYILRERSGDRAVVEQVREMMDRQINHMARMVDDLLDSSRLTRGRVTLHPERVDLARLLRLSAEDHRGTLDSAGLALRLEIADGPVWIEGDATRLTQVFHNLLENAGKFTNRGGSVCVSLQTAEDQAVIRIADTGSGIDATMLPRLFEPFTQEDRSLDRSRGGLGLGLALAKNLIELHGGTIEAASPGAGHGAEFTIRLPLQAEPGSQREKPQTTPPPRKHLRVLIVEDNRDAAESLRVLLKMFDYDVTVAHTGPEGVAAALRTRPEVVVCDIGLPGMDGFAVAQALRTNPETARARLIALTGYGQERDRELALQAGFDGHLIKPVDPERLIGQIGQPS
jgi:PAS domain S-box-containing protein